PLLLGVRRRLGVCVFSSKHATGRVHLPTMRGMRLSLPCLPSALSAFPCSLSPSSPWRPPRVLPFLLSSYPLPLSSFRPPLSLLFVSRPTPYSSPSWRLPASLRFLFPLPSRSSSFGLASAGVLAFRPLWVPLCAGFGYRIGRLSTC